MDKAATTTALSAAPNPSTFGQSVTFTATVSPSVPGGAGTMTFKDGATVLGSSTTIGGVATMTFTGLSVGPHSITASYGGDASYTASTSPAVTQTVNQAATTTALNAAPNPSTFGQSVTFTATLSPGVPNGGTVTFKDGATVLGTGTTSGSVATLSTTALAVGPHSITATYNGDPSYTASTSLAVTQTVNQAATTTALSTAPNPSTFGQAVTFTATVSPGVPDGGTVTFKDGATVIGTGTTSGGVATFSTTALAVGPHAITATYGGSTSYIGSTSPAVTQTVNQAATTTALGAAPNPSTFGQSVTFTATVSPGVPNGGTVTFKDGVTVIGTGTTSGSVATFSTTALAVGPHSITATYGGSASYTASTSPAVTQTVNQIPTAVALSSSGSPSLQGQAVTFTATVSPATAPGTVTFRDGATVLGTAPVGSGKATIPVSTLAAGGHSITATYNGDTNHASNVSPPLPHTVTPNGTIVLSVATSEGDGSFSFSSPTGALNLQVKTSGGAGTSTAVSLNPGTYKVTVAPPDGFGITAVTCSDADSSGSAQGKSATIALAPAETVTCTFASVNSRKKTAGVIGKFMGKRADMMLSQGPDAGRQIDRLIDANAGSGKAGEGTPSEGKTAGSIVPTAPKVAGGPRSFEARLSELKGDDASAAPSPFGVQGSSEGSTSLSFSTSLSKAMGLGAKAKPDGSPAAPPKTSLFDIWTEVRYTSFDDARGGFDTGGHFGIAYLGADYIVSKNLLVGVLAQFDDMEETSRTGGYRISGKGWMVGPYATLRLSEHLYLQGRAAWGKSANVVSPYGTYTDDFGTVRWLASAAMVGHWTFGNWQLRPSASIAMLEDSSASYVDSLGVTIPGLKVSLGQFKAGPEVSYRFNLPSGTVIEPRLGAHLIWNFDASELPVDLGGTLTGPEGARGRIELGVGLKFDDGVMIDLGAGYDGIGSSDFNAVTGKATVRVPLN